MGRAVLEQYVSTIADWQRCRSGNVIIDGAFQYMRWGCASIAEASSKLDKERTIRTICPTKAVAIHGVRFSYCLIPAELREEFRYAYANTSGSGCIYDYHAASAIMRYINNEGSNHALLRLIRSRYHTLAEGGYISDEIGATMTYFCFAHVNIPGSKLIEMDQTFFDTRCYPGMTRVNLLMPQRDLDDLTARPAAARRPPKIQRSMP